jgi:hypothetical protein
MIIGCPFGTANLFMLTHGVSRTEVTGIQGITPLYKNHVSSTSDTGLGDSFTSLPDAKQG